MKKMKLFTAGIFVIAAATLASCGAKKGCLESKDDKYDSSASESDSTKCDENTTSGKFSRNNSTYFIDGNSSNGTYVATITQASADYQVILLTNFGLEDGSGNPLPAFPLTCNVDQDRATFSYTLSPGSISGELQYVKASSKVNIQITIAGTGSGADGTTTDTEQ